MGDAKAEAVLKMQEGYAKNPQQHTFEKANRERSLEHDDAAARQTHTRFTSHGRPEWEGNSTFNILNNSKMTAWDKCQSRKAALRSGRMPANANNQNESPPGQSYRDSQRSRIFGQSRSESVL